MIGSDSKIHMVDKKSGKKKKIVKKVAKELSREPDKSNNDNKLSFIDNLKDNIIEQKRISGDDNKVSTDDIFRMLDLYFYKNFYQYRHLHNSYDKFIDESVMRFFREVPHVFAETITDEKEIRHRFIFDNIRVVSPKHTNQTDPMFPADARHLALTYSLTIYADVTQIKETINLNSNNENKIKTIKVGQTEVNKPIAFIPVMVRSKYCNLNAYKEETKDECDYDPGGHFIVNGSEKVVISQDRMIDNSPMVFIKKNSNISYYVVQVNSRSNEPNGMMQTVSIKIKKDNVMMIKVPILNEVNVMTIFRALGVESDRDIIDLCVNDSTDKHMIELVRASLDDCVNDTLQDIQTKIQTQEESLDYLIGKMRVLKRYTESNQYTKLEQKKLHLMELFKTSMFPHITGTLKDKAQYLGYIINKLMRVYLKRLPVDNRDSYVKKRVDCIDDLFMELFKQQYKNIMLECNKLFTVRTGDLIDSDEPYNVVHQFKPGTFEQGIKASLMIGSWPRKKGVSQMLQRMSYMLLLSFLSRIDSQSGGQSSSKLTKPRHIDPSSIGCLCPVQTPEHAKIGLIKHLSLIGSITIGDKENYETVKEFIKTWPDIKLQSEISPDKWKKMYRVFLDGEPMGMVENTHQVGFDGFRSNPIMRFYAEAETRKLTGAFNTMMTSVVLDHKENELRFYTDSGRLYRPILRVNGDNELVLTKDMINQISLDKKEGDKITDWHSFYMNEPYPIKFLDLEEQPYSMITHNIKNLRRHRKRILDSKDFKFDGQEHKIVNRYDENFYVRYDYCEIHPSVLLGEIATNIPFCDRNQAPRNIFQYAQGRQGMGIYVTTYRSRTDISYILYHPQVPIVNTRTSKYTYTDVLPPGENATVAIACYSGYNQEDSLVFNRTALQRGFFRTMSLKKQVSAITKNQVTSGDEKFMKPPPEKTIGMKNGQYDKLNEKGYIPEETPVVNGDVVFGKVTPISDMSESDKIFKDSSDQYRSHAPGVVDRMYVGIKNQDGFETRKALVRSERTPLIGDKFCCFSPDHEVLTTNGWINIDEITKDHKVATLINGHILMYTNPLEIQEYDYDGKMYEVDSNMVKLKVTPNHRMFVKTRTSKHFKIEKAEDIKGLKRKYKKNVEHYLQEKCHSDYINNMRNFILPGHDDLETINLDMKAFLTLLGVWIAEGCISIKDWALVFATHKNRVKIALEEACEILGFKIHKHIDKNDPKSDVRDRWCIPDKRLVNFIKPLNVGAVNKYLPDFVWELRTNEAKWLIDGMLLGDGHTMKNGTKRYDTSSIKLADQFQRLCLHAGYSTNRTLKYKAGHVSICQSGDRKGEIFKSTVDSYRLTIITKQNNPIVNKTEKSDKYVDYKGKVHCCTVVGDGVIYVRHNGYPVWCGNSRHGQAHLPVTGGSGFARILRRISLKKNEITFYCGTL